MHYLLGGDNLARDIFSRVMSGATIVILIAPLATLVRLYGRHHSWVCPRDITADSSTRCCRSSQTLSWPFPVILLFYLLVTPEIVNTGLPNIWQLSCSSSRWSSLRS